MENNDTLSRIENYLRIIVKDIIDNKVEKYITDPKEKKVYEMTGNAIREDIVKQTGISAGTISSLWVKWEAKGLIIKDGKIFKKVFS